MPVALPLALIGLALVVFYLFASATYALPLILGVAAGFAADALGASSTAALAIGILAWLAAIATGRFAALTMTGPVARLAIPMLFAVPAAIAGYAVANSLAGLAGIGGFGTVMAPIAGLVCAAVAARRVSQPVA